MAAVQILALIAAVLLLAYVMKEKIVDVLPMTVCMLVLVLFVLGLTGHLSWIDFVSIGVLAGAVIWFIWKDGDTKKDIGRYLMEAVKEPGTVIIIVTILIVCFCVRNKMVTWWDDFNFWATDVKSLFYLDGFAGKYTNVAPEFGDYPPGTQMMKWWFLHFSPSEFREGLMFGGYYFMNLVFLAPLLRYLAGKSVFTGIINTDLPASRFTKVFRSGDRWNDKNFIFIMDILLWVLCGAALWVFPSVAESFYLDGTCADLTGALIYGAFLVSVLDREGHKEIFYYGRLSLYLMVLVLIKNVTFFWAGFGLFFLLIYHINHSLKIWKWQVVMALTVLAGGSWLALCYFTRRVARLTGRAIDIALSDFDLMDHSHKLVSSFIEAFVAWPLHRFQTIMIDLTPLGMCLLTVLFFGILIGTKKVKAAAGVKIGLFLLVSGLLYYGILLVSHLTLFVLEMQYLDPFSMVSSIERYGAPFTIGTLYVTAYLFLRSSKSFRIGYLICILFVVLTADHQSAWRGLIGYESRLEANQRERDEIIDENADRFLETVKKSEAVPGRILYLKNASDISWVQHAYLAYLASPVSVVSNYLDGSAEDWGVIRQIVRESHASYIYINPMGEHGREYFEKITEGGAFEYRQIYRIEEQGEDLKFISAPFHRQYIGD